MRGLYTDNDLRILLRHRGGRLSVHVVRVLLDVPPPIPLPTMFSIESTRVCERSMIRCLKSSKLRQPELPASTTVVTPDRSMCASG